MTATVLDWPSCRAALRQVLPVLGVPGAEVPTEPPSDTDPIAMAAARAGIRARHAVLRESLDSLPRMPIVAVRRGEAMVLLASRRGWTISAPTSGAPTRALAQADIDQLDRHAWVMERRLPSEGLRGWRLLPFALRGSGPAMTGTVVTGLLVSALSFAVPVVSLFLVMALLLQQDGRVPWLCLAVISTVPLGWLLGGFRDRCVATVQTGLQAGLEPAVWDRLLHLPLSFFRRHSTSRLFNHASGVGRLRGMLGSSGLDALVNVVFAALAVALLSIVDVVLGLVAMGIAITLLAVVSWLSWRQHKHDLEVYDAVESVQSTVYPALLGIDEVRVYGAQDLVFARWWKIYSRQKREDDAGLRYAELSMALISAALPLFLSALLPLIAARGIGGQAIWAASFAAVQLNLVLIRLPVVLQALLWVPAMHARLLPILTTAPEVEPTAALPGRLTGFAELRHVTFGYADSTEPVLNGLNLFVHPGEFLAVVGESGSGKSTLLRLLLGLDRPERGAVLLDGDDLRDLDLDVVRGQIGYVPQDSKVPRGDIRSIILGSSVRRDDATAWRSAELAGIAGDIRALPMGMDTQLTDGLTGFSGGQMQRLLIARALAKQPRFLLLDEATSALDSATQDQVSAAIDALGITRIVVAHRLSTIRRADRIVVLSQGRIVESGTYEGLVAAGGRFAALAASNLI
ncbi:ATP-binding cassette domain-containing protein [Streptomyces sp. NPDC051976]|uniref:ATP-binding cassette domain-containing protein n=1 Tax=Streptomyces sp. NPDC051976 TaxID=3154947 RepID=UPI00342A5BB1